MFASRRRRKEAATVKIGGVLEAAEKKKCAGSM